MEGIQQQDNRTRGHRGKGYKAAKRQFGTVAQRQDHQSHHHQQGQGSVFVNADIIQARQEIHTQIGSRAQRKDPQVPEDPVIILAGYPFFQPFHLVDPVLHVHRFTLDYGFHHFLFFHPGSSGIHSPLGKERQQHGRNHDHFRTQGQVVLEKGIQGRRQCQRHQCEPRNVHRNIRPHFAGHCVLYRVKHPFSALHGHKPYRQERVPGIGCMRLGCQRLFRLRHGIGK